MLCRNSAHSGTYRSAFFKYENAVFNGEQEKESMIRAGLVIRNYDPLDGVFSLTICLLMTDFYTISEKQSIRKELKQAGTFVYFITTAYI